MTPEQISAAARGCEVSMVRLGDVEAYSLQGWEPVGMVRERMLMRRTPANATAPLMAPGFAEAFVALMRPFIWLERSKAKRDAREEVMSLVVQRAEEPALRLAFEVLGGGNEAV